MTPYYWCRELVALGRYNSNEVGPRTGGKLHPFFEAVMGGKEIWVVTTWRRYEDGREEGLTIRYLDPEATEAEARKSFEQAVDFLNTSREELEALSKCFAATEEDIAYVESRMPSETNAASRSIDESDLYQARLKVLAGMQPKTVELLNRAESETDPLVRGNIEREAVQAFFGDMAHYWTEDMVKEWQKSNPVGTEWMSHFVRVLSEPKRVLDAVNHELVLNWLWKKYNLLTAEELSEAIFEVTEKRIKPATLKKRRERFGLTTKRPPGPRPNSEQ